MVVSATVRRRHGSAETVVLDGVADVRIVGLDEADRDHRALMCHGELRRLEVQSGLDRRCLALRCRRRFGDHVGLDYAHVDELEGLLIHISQRELRRGLCPVVRGGGCHVKPAPRQDRPVHHKGDEKSDPEHTPVDPIVSSPITHQPLPPYKAFPRSAPVTLL